MKTKVRYLSIREVADRCKVSKSSVKHWIEKGIRTEKGIRKLKAVHSKKEGHYKVHPESVLNFLAKK